jgi:hypothetical protein
MAATVIDINIASLAAWQHAAPIAVAAAQSRSPR